MPEFTDAHGIAIVYDVHEPAVPPRGVIQLLHGVGEHAGRYAHVIEAPTGAGFIVYADDHRGHGRTGMRQHGDARRLGRLGPGGHDAAVAAVHRLSEIIRDAHPELRRAAEHISQPDRIAWKSMCATSEGREKGEKWCKRAIWRNTLPAVKHAWKSVDKLTSGAFVGMWRGRVADFYSKYMATAAASATQ